MNQGSYFLSGTKVAAPLGEKPIQHLRNSDRIVAYNPDTEKRETAAVKKPFKETRTEYLLINNVLRTTDLTILHRENGDPVLAKDLKEDDVVLGRYGNITIRTVEHFDQDVDVYTIEDNKPFYAENFLVG